MTHIFNFPFANPNSHDKSTANKICETIKTTVDKSPVAKFALGIIPLPLMIGLQIAAGKAFELAGHHTSIYDDSKNFFFQKFEAFSQKSLINFSSNSCIAEPIFYGEFIQNYLLDDRLSVLLKKISPDHVDFLKTTKGKITRIVATSLVGFGISLGWSYSYDSYNKPAHILARAVNQFISVAFFGSLREVTNSNLPSIGLNYFRYF